MPIGIIFDRHEMKGKTRDFQTWRMGFFSYYDFETNAWIITYLKCSNWR